MSLMAWANASESAFLISRLSLSSNGSNFPLIIKPGGRRPRWQYKIREVTVIQGSTRLHARKTNLYDFNKPTKHIEIIKGKYAQENMRGAPPFRHGQFRHGASGYVDSASCVAGKYEVKWQDQKVVCHGCGWRQTGWKQQLVPREHVLCPRCLFVGVGFMSAVIMSGCPGTTTLGNCLVPVNLFYVRKLDGSSQ